MIHLKGVAVCDGVAMGPLWQPDAARNASPGAQSSLLHAQRLAQDQLRGLADACRRAGDEDAAELMETHLLLLTDEDYVAAIHQGLQAGEDLPGAVRSAGDAFAAELAALPDPYMQARAADVRDVTERLLAAVTGQEAPAWPEEPFILAAEDLSPSQCIGLRGAPVLGIALSGGSSRGHTAILTRSRGIPAAFGLGDELTAAGSGRVAILDGGQGCLTLDPDEAAQAAFRDAQREAAARREAAEAVRGLPDETRDGRRLAILCSIAGTEDCRAVLDNDGRDVGLLRSELLFLTDRVPPGEERQLRAYAQVARAMAGRRVVIRLMDLGADKQAAWLPLPREENPALGLRGIRLLLARPELLRTQLRAVCRASASGKVAVLLPMVTTAEEVHLCRRMIGEVQSDLAREGFAFDPAMEMGVMLETPAAALTVTQLAAEADFFSLGTNDLTQYILASDRQGTPHEGGPAQGRHPAVLRVLRMAAEEAGRAGKPITICGEMGGDAALLPFFLEIGVSGVTVPPGDVLPLRAALRRLDGPPV